MLDFGWQKQRVGQIFTGIWIGRLLPSQGANRKQIGGSGDDDGQRVNINSDDVLENLPQFGGVGSVGVSGELVRDGSPQETAGTAGWIKHAYKSFGRQKFSDDALT